MPIIDMQGNIFSMISKVDSIVNPVNCEGIMGKGLALSFKLRFPHMFNSYSYACHSRKLRPGIMHWYKHDNLYIVNFPTKHYWKLNSRIEYIKDGLSALIKDLMENKDIKSIAIPPLGCGLGGLDWNDVKPMIVNVFNEKMPDITVYLFNP